MKELLAPLKDGNTPNLEDFQCIFHLAPPTFDSQPFALSSAPLLKRLYVIHAPIHVNFGHQIHRIQLIDIRLRQNSQFSLEDLFRCLTQCPSLTTLNVSISKSSLIAIEHMLPTMISLPHLHSLILIMYKGIDPCLLFDQIFLPSLATLKVTMYGFSTSEWQHLLPLLKRSRPPLLSLELDGVPMTEQTLIECLSYMPKLTELTFGGIDCSDSTLVALTVDNDEGVPSANLCPLLQVIGIGTSSFSAIALKNMILSRWVDPAAPTTSLPRKSLEIVRCPAFEIYSALSDPAIVNCLRNGLKMVEWEADVDQEDDEDDDSDSDTDVDDTDDGGYDTEEEDWEEEGGDDPDLLQ